MRFGTSLTFGEAVSALRRSSLSSRRVIPEGGREREPSPDEIRTFIDHAAEIANDTLVEEVTS